MITAVCLGPGILSPGTHVARDLFFLRIIFFWGGGLKAPEFEET